MTIFVIRSWAGKIRNIPARYPLISNRVLVRQIAQFGQDPLIMNQMIDVRKTLKIELSGGLSTVIGHPVGTRPISKGAQSVKVKRLRVIFRFAK